MYRVSGNVPSLRRCTEFGAMCRSWGHVSSLWRCAKFGAMCQVFGDVPSLGRCAEFGAIVVVHKKGGGGGQPEFFQFMPIFSDPPWNSQNRHWKKSEKTKKLSKRIGIDRKKST